MAPVREVLLDARTRFHDLLSADLEQLFAKAVADDDLQHVSGCQERCCWLAALSAQSTTHKDWHHVL